MPLNPRVLRRIFAGGAVLVVLVVCGFYLRGIVKVRRQLGRLPEKIASNLAQSTTGFTFSKSEGGRTLFTIHAAQAKQFKDDGRAELHDVSIVVYGREASRFDQIYGTDFEYDQRTGEVVARGEVHIDLESDSSGALRPDQAPPQEMKNPIHLNTSGLSFNQKTGFAQTRERIEFRIPEAVGSAVGATYDSKSNVLTLRSAVQVSTTGKQKAVITAQRATFMKEPRRAELQAGRVEQGTRAIEADRITLMLREDNTVERISGAGHVRFEENGPKSLVAEAPQAELLMGPAQQLKNGSLSGGVTFESRGKAPGKGAAERVLFDFGARNELAKVRAEGSVAFSQGDAASTAGLKADAIDLLVSGGRRLERATTSGAAQIERTEGTTHYVITAGSFQGRFSADNRVAGVIGTGETRVVASTPGQPDRITTSRELIANFDNQGAISQLEQHGDFRYQEGQRAATAEHARFSPAEDNITLIGSPRVVDSGVTLTAQSIQLNRKAGTAFAQGQVKATFSDLKHQANGGMLSSADPIHMTGATMLASRHSESARFTNARLWQGKNIIDAPSITFDRARRDLLAQGTAAGRVSAVLVQTGKDAESIPIRVLADRLSYVDAERRAVFSGKVEARSADMTTFADNVQLFLLPPGAQGGNQLDRMIAQGDVRMQQPTRKASGNRLLYSAQEGKLVMTGTKTNRPTILDAEKGQVTGDSLTFYIHDDRVLIDSKESSPTVIQTRIPDAGKK